MKVMESSLLEYVLDCVYNADVKSIQHKLYNFLLIIHNLNKLHNIPIWNFHNYGIEAVVNMNLGNEKSPMIIILQIFFS